MEQKTLSRWLKGILVGVALCGLIVYAAVVPVLADCMLEGNSEFAAAVLPWKIFI